MTLARVKCLKLGLLTNETKRGGSQFDASIFFYFMYDLTTHNFLQRSPIYMIFCFLNWEIMFGLISCTLMRTLDLAGVWRHRRSDDGDGRHLQVVLKSLQHLYRVSADFMHLDENFRPAWSMSIIKGLTMETEGSCKRSATVYSSFIVSRPISRTLMRTFVLAGVWLSSSV